MNIDGIKLKTIGVIGAGTMGNGIAQVFATSGFNVTLVDISQQALDKGVASIGSSLDRMIKKEIVSEDDKSTALASISCSTSITALASVEFVVEAVTENPGVKFSILKEVDNVCPKNAIIASNTSSISLTKLAAQTSRSEKVIGMHFMNPVPVMKLVEIIRALQTDDETCNTTEQLTLALGKTPVFANDSPGFVSNRILIPMINEAIFALHEGIAAPESIDEIMKLGMHHPIGPLALADLIGLDVVLSVLRVLQDGMGDPKFRPCPLLVQMVDANRLGRKTGIGFYQYDQV